MNGRYLGVDIRFISLLVVIVIVIAGMTALFQPEEDREPTLSVKAFASSFSGRAPLNISFTCEYLVSDAKISKVLWDFDDGNRSSHQLSDHVFRHSGHYCVELTVWAGEISVTDMIDITVFEFQDPVAVISANDTCGKAPFSVSFTSGSYDIDGKILSYEWDFGDGYKVDTMNAVHTYDSPGDYYAWLTVIDDDGLQSTDSIQITVIENYLPHAIASADDFSGKAPLTVLFHGQCEDLDDENIAYRWEFSDTFLSNNRVSTEQDTKHTFWVPGTYYVTLFVTDEDGATDSMILEIIVEESLFSWAVEKITPKILSHLVPDMAGTMFMNAIIKIICRVIF